MDSPRPYATVTTRQQANCVWEGDRRASRDHQPVAQTRPSDRRTRQTASECVTTTTAQSCSPGSPRQTSPARSARCRRSKLACRLVGEDQRRVACDRRGDRKRAAARPRTAPAARWSGAPAETERFQRTDRSQAGPVAVLPVARRGRRFSAAVSVSHRLPARKGRRRRRRRDRRPARTRRARRGELAECTHVARPTGRSSPAARASRVLLPHPDGPDDRHELAAADLQVYAAQGNGLHRPRAIDAKTRREAPAPATRRRWAGPRARE